MVEIFYKTYYYIFNIFFDYYCIYLLHRNYSFFIEIIHLRLFYGKQKRKCCGTAAEKLPAFL